MKDFNFPLLNRPIDVSKDFMVQENNYFMAAEVLEFDSRTATGVVEFKRYARKPRVCFNQTSLPFEETMAWEFPPEYGEGLKVPSGDFLRFPSYGKSYNDCKSYV